MAPVACPTGPTEVSPPRVAVARLEHVSRRFGSTIALDGVDLELHSREVVGLLGPNGAGKSTAVAVLLGLRAPDAGRAVLFGRNPRDPDARRSVGVVLQEVGFPETLRVGEIARLVAAHHEAHAGWEGLRHRFGLAELERRQAGGLSGGERRRLAVALAMIGRPRLLVLDEPTAGVDPAGRRRLWRGLRAFVANGGTVLLTTQRLDEAEQFATRIVVLARGRVVLSGTVGEIRARAGLARVALRASTLPSLRAATAVESNGGRHVVYTHDAKAVVAELVRAGVPLDELEVSAVSLEDAFLSLTQEPR